MQRTKSVDGNLDNPEQFKKYFYHTDHLGSTIAVTDEAGNKVWDGEYTPFGIQLSGEGELLKAAKFTGKDLDEDIGLYYFNARWYDQELGRFVSEDPVKDGMNWYVYCGNNPLYRLDPSGLSDYSLQEKIDKANEWQLQEVNEGTWDNKYTSYTYIYTNGHGETLKTLVYTTPDGVQHYMSQIIGASGRIFETYVYTVDPQGNLRYSYQRVDRRTIGQIVWDGVTDTLGKVTGLKATKKGDPYGLTYMPFLFVVWKVLYQKPKNIKNHI